LIFKTMHMKRLSVCFLVLLCFVSSGLFAQEEEVENLPQDSLYLQMKSLANDGYLDSAKNMAYHILSLDPGHTDVSIFLAMIYGRKMEFDSAFILLNPVLDTMPSNGDAHIANCALYYWSNRWQALFDATTKALYILPDNTDIIYQRSLALYKLNRDEEAINLLGELLLKDPEHGQAKLLQEQMSVETQETEFFSMYSYDHFTSPYIRNWHMATIGGIYPIKPGAISPYMNVGHFVDVGNSFIESTAFQLNMDAYLDITETNSLVLGYGISTANYFPRHRAMINISQKLPAAWSVSAGARYFYFDQHYVFYSLGLDKYYGNFWFDLNNYIFRKDYGISVASYLTVRRYMENKYNYISATIGYGTSPDEPITSIIDIQRLNAVSLRINLMKQISRKIRLGCGVGYQYEEYLELQYRNRITAQAAFYFKLNK
jgi:YaiO family outer membrane protein